MVIWKFQLRVADMQIVEMPSGAEILSVQDQNGGLQMWAMVNPDAAKQQRTIEIVGTGNQMDNIISKGLKRVHIDTVQTCHGSLVWHVFERV